jgi:hypothetical protein
VFRCPHCGENFQIDIIGIDCAKDLKEVKDQEQDQKKGPRKTFYGDFVNMTVDEYDKLLKRFGGEATRLKIDRLDNYIGSTGKRYRSHYHTILNWAAKDAPTPTLEPKVIHMRKCDVEGCKLDGKNPHYGRWFCRAHLPL